ncbi:MAG: dihydroorotate dehydrogenase electron transfer subunit [Clostridiales bacterium]|jgi:dihydroorotate dehydrogenase electron transfer subunit|nr:dihydroorotate dehydrogenase electron transfer subunit [Clostridiales bacterium]
MFQFKIVDKERLNDMIYSFQIDAAAIARQAKPGQFLHILPEGNVTLRRPISICEINDNRVRFIFEVVGEGTRLIAKKQVGETLNVLGPLGKGFGLYRNIDMPKIMLIGGGIGVFPLLQLAKDAKLSVKANSFTYVVLGFRSKKHVVLENDFNRYANKLHITTDDGTCGEEGFVTAPARRIIDSEEIDGIFACGPKPMLKEVAKLAKNAGIYCEVSMEQRMACGIGTCVGCVIKTTSGYKSVCKDGPVFDASEVDFDD